jgi:hypothetical protein
MKVIYASHRDNTVFRVVVQEPPKKGYRLEFFDPEGSYTFEVNGRQIREIGKAVDGFRAEQATAAAAARETVDAEVVDPEESGGA